MSLNFSYLSFTLKPSIYNSSILQSIKSIIASRGVLTIVLPCKLKEVFKLTPYPVIFFNSDSTSTTFSHQADTLLRQALTDFSLTFSYRQPLDLENSSYIGFTAGYHIIRSRNRDITLFDISLFDLGLVYYQALSEKNPDIDEYRVVFYSKLNMQFPLGNKDGEMFMLEPGVQFNLSKNIGLSVFGNLMLAGESIKLPNKDRITYKQTA